MKKRNFQLKFQKGKENKRFKKKLNKLKQDAFFQIFLYKKMMKFPEKKTTILNTWNMRNSIIRNVIKKRRLISCLIYKKQFHEECSKFFNIYTQCGNVLSKKKKVIIFCFIGFILYSFIFFNWSITPWSKDLTPDKITS